MVFGFDQRRAVILDAWQAGIIPAAAAIKALARISRIERAAEREKAGR